MVTVGESTGFIPFWILDFGFECLVTQELQNFKWTRLNPNGEDLRTMMKKRTTEDTEVREVKRGKREFLRKS